MKTLFRRVRADIGCSKGFHYHLRVVEKDPVASLGPTLRAWRKKTGLTLAVLAERAGVDAGFLAYIESGKKTPSLQTLAKLASALGLPISGLFTELPPGADDPREQCSRHLRILCRGLNKKEMADILEVLKLLERPGIARAIRVLAGR